MAKESESLFIPNLEKKKNNYIILAKSLESEYKDPVEL